MENSSFGCVCPSPTYSPGKFLWLQCVIWDNSGHFCTAQEGPFLPICFPQCGSGDLPQSTVFTLIHPRNSFSLRLTIWYPQCLGTSILFTCSQFMALSWLNSTRIKSIQREKFQFVLNINSTGETAAQTRAKLTQKSLSRLLEGKKELQVSEIEKGSSPVWFVVVLWEHRCT